MKRIFAAAMFMAALAAGTALSAEERKKAPSAASGREMYRAYCASCHGLLGDGRGPVAPALKKPPADLTSLARRNGGRFPAVRVYQSIEGSVEIAAHGTREMPVWGTVFRERGGGDEARVKLQVHNLTSYIESLQSK